jgi:hypothetical protein
MTRFILLLFVGLVSCAQFSAKDDSLARADAPLKDYAAKHTEALAYCKEKKFCEDYYFLLDMSVHSGKNRFYVYDFKQNKIVDQNLVTHGSCDVPTNYADKWEKARYSNKDGSHCTSLGKYKIGKRDYSSWGINVKYWLHGLEDSNSNAVSRVVVLHSWDAVANTEIFPEVSPLSWGCPAVSDNFMKKLDTKLQAQKKPVLLWIVE